MKIAALINAQAGLDFFLAIRANVHVDDPTSRMQVRDVVFAAVGSVILFLNVVVFVVVDFTKQNVQK